MNTKTTIISMALWMISLTTAWAQTTIVSKGKAKGRIVCTEKTATNTEAAEIMQLFVERISGANLPIAYGATTRQGDIVIGEQTNKADEDGFSIETIGKSLHIKSGGDRGAIYGVATLLEKWMGVNYYAKDVYTLSKSKDIILPRINHAETPAFRFRQTFSYGNDDPIYKRFMRLESHDELFASDMWVHTFNQILPADKYGKAHPEYYSMINGKRQPGTHSQWCLTNPEVLELACEKIDSIFRANPDRKMISISQNDGNGTYCQCPECKKVEEEEGAVSGNYIRFLNKLAQRFPDKEFSTLAYLFTMEPPKKTRPLKNVNIMLCDIDCKREVPLTDNESGHQFVKALEGWSAISDNIFIWDYVINFDGVVTPFPNFHCLQKNISLFKHNHATMLFEQNMPTRGTDFLEMKAWILAKLMWNPEQDTDSLMVAFMNGYYHEAAPYMYQYQKLLQGALLASGKELWIYDSPITHKDGMLNAKLCKTYNELFDKAENAVKGDTAVLNRVRLSRLPLQYSELEIARTNPDRDAEETSQLLNLFEQRTKEYGVRTLNERENRPEDYCRLYRERFLPVKERNIALGKNVSFLSAPSGKYAEMGAKALTDGLYGGTTYVESWVGWEGRDADFVIDLGKKESFQEVTADFLLQSGAWILWPKSVTYSISNDNNNWQPIGTFTFNEDRSLAVKFQNATVITQQPVNAQYVRVSVKGIGKCPSWHYGVGYDAWFFIDEVKVK